MTAAEVTGAVRAGRLVAILRAARPDHLVTGAQVLVDEGVEVLEFPLTGPHVLEVISEAADTLQGRAFVGAGTVRTVDDARRALQAGASFVVSPGLSVPVVEHALAHDAAVLPGTFTPTEIDLALQAGAELVKLFPASAHDPEFVRQVRVPLPLAGVVPTGGVRLDEAAHWLAAGAVALGIGSPLTGDSPDDRQHRRVAPSRQGLEGSGGLTMDLLTYGETMGLLACDRVGPMRLGGPMRLSMAGAESTVAIGVARLGGSAQWVGVVGDDEIGRLITRVLRAEGVQTDGVVVDPEAPTSLLLQERRTSQVTRVLYYRRSNAGSHLGPEHVLPDDIQRARVLHVSGITPALSASAREAVFRALHLARTAGTITSVDLNFRSKLWSAEEAAPVLTDLVKFADVVLATREEAALLTPRAPGDAVEAAESLRCLGPRLAVVKGGADGAVACDDGQIYVIPAKPAEVIDPVGAGDAFAAGLLADLARGASPHEALETAAVVAAINVACPGDWEGLPTGAELALHRGTDVLR